MMINEIDLRDRVEPIIRAAGEIVLSYVAQARSLSRREKPGAGFVTKADIESEQFLIKNLSKVLPEADFYAEESGVSGNGEYRWVIDPLDGTSNFVRNIPLFGISIGLTHHGKPIMGVLNFPALGMLVYAERGKGAYADGKSIAVSDRSIQTSLFHASGDEAWSRTRDILHEKCGLLKVLGSSSYEFAHIAMGDAELYIRENSPHDVVAGIAILEEAGGKITDERGNPWTLESSVVIASNGMIHDDVLGLLINEVE